MSDADDDEVTDLLNEFFDHFDNDVWDGDEAMEAILLRVAEFYGPLDRLLAAIPYEGGGDDVVVFALNRADRTWSNVTEAAFAAGTD